MNNPISSFIGEEVISLYDALAARLTLLTTLQKNVQPGSAWVKASEVNIKIGDIFLARHVQRDSVLKQSRCYLVRWTANGWVTESSIPLPCTTSNSWIELWTDKDYFKDVVTSNMCNI